jgi:hypothetical protein
MFPQDIDSNTDDLLPPVLKEVTDLIGFPAMIRLIDALGGTDFTFSTRADQRFGMLIQAVGSQNAHILCEHFCGDVYIPRASVALRKWRDQQFVSDVLARNAQGTSLSLALSELCPHYGFSMRWGWVVLGRYQPDTTKQGSLF